MSNLLKGYWVSVEEESRVVDSNDIVMAKVQEEAQKQAKLKALSENAYDSDEFFEGLPTENLDAVFEDTDSSGDTETPVSNIIKAREHSELDGVLEELEQARNELEEIRNEASRILEEANGEAETIRTEAFNEGKNEGYDAGYNEGMISVNSMRKELEDEAAALKEDYNARLLEAEPMLVDIITDIYEHIFGIELESYKNLVSNLLTDTLIHSGQSKDIIVHISREDYLFVTENKDEIFAQTGMSENNIEFVQDATLSRTECMIETPSGVYDCSLETELKELKRKLMLLAYRKDEY